MRTTASVLLGMITASLALAHTNQESTSPFTNQDGPPQAPPLHVPIVPAAPEYTLEMWGPDIAGVLFEGHIVAVYIDGYVIGEDPMQDMTFGQCIGGAIQACGQGRICSVTYYLDPHGDGVCDFDCYDSDGQCDRGAPPQGDEDPADS